MLKAAILSEAKNLKTEMFRFAQHDRILVERRALRGER
jgi:hypothetical protein